MKRSIRILLLLAFIIMSFTGSVEAANVGLAPNVTEGMCNPVYWLKLSANIDQPIMTAGQIAELNKRIEKTTGTKVVDLESIPEQFDGHEMVKKLMQAFTEPKECYIQWNLLDYRYYDEVKYNISSSKTSSMANIQYGVAVNLTVLKDWPVPEVLSKEAEDWEWDMNALTGVNVNEPLIIYFYSRNGEYAYVQTRNYKGWISVDDIAVCANRDEWLNILHEQNILIVTGNRVYTEPSLVDKKLSEKRLNMGTILSLDQNPDNKVQNRYSWNNYIVRMPMRGPNGRLVYKQALISQNRDVHVGYLNLTTRNVLNQAFKCLGDRYGWGGMLYSNDCSGYVLNIYRCFGIEMGRDTDNQEVTPVNKIRLSDLSGAEKMAKIRALRPGSLIYTNNHVMMYLGCVDNKIFVIHNTAMKVNPEKNAPEVRSVVISEMTLWDRLTYAISF